MKSISEWLRMHKLGSFDVVVTSHMPERTVAVVQGGKVVGAIIDSAETGYPSTVVDGKHVPCTHDGRVVETDRRDCPTCRSRGFPVSVLGPDRCAFCDGTEGGSPPTLP